MKIRTRVLAAVAAATTSMSVAMAGVAVVSPAEAAGGLKETGYGFQGRGFGSRITSDLVGLESGRSANSLISCTSLAGLTDEETLADISLPADNPYIQISGIKSNTRTYTKRKQDIAAAVTGINRIAEVRLGGGEFPLLTIKGLKTQSTAWATRSGKLKTRNKVSSVELDLVNLPQTPLTAPLQDLLDALEQGIGQVLDTLRQYGGDIEIPGLGNVSIGFDRHVKKQNWAAASSYVLRVKLYGPDMAAGGGDDSLVGIGRSWARIDRHTKPALMAGMGYGAQGEVLDGVLSIGKLGEQPLPCTGTDGKVLDTPVAGLTPDAAFDLALIEGRAFGTQRPNGAARAWTSGSVGELVLGPLTIKGIVGRAQIKQNKFGKIVRNDIKGSTIGEVIVDGQSMGGFGPGEAAEIPADGIPGVLKIELFKKEKRKRSMRVSAVVITLLEDTAGATTLRLGNANVRLKRY